HRLESFVVVDESTGNTVAYCAGLTAFTTTMNIDVEVKRFLMIGEHQRLTYDHTAGFASKVLVDRLAVHHDVARTLFQEHAGDRSLAAAGAIVPITDHDLSLDFQGFGLL